MRDGPDKTLADYVTIALSPLLIMLMVGSLLFFLVEVLYQGEYKERVLWVLACFDLATVLIARISITEGAERAGMFGAVLACATAVVINRLVTSMAWPINISLLALAWWCNHRLTWDCTLIDDSEDASGEGLLQAAGLDTAPSAPGRDARAAAPATSTSEKDPEQKRKPAPRTWWRRVFELFFPGKRPHPPGLWVVYFSLAALPLFGLGQAMLPDDEATRRYAFSLLALYTACGLGLLLTTSFLGLRRYLRQRKLQMPVEMTGAWLTLGGVLIVALMVGAIVLPRPKPEYQISSLSGSFSSPEQRASWYDMLGGNGAKGPGKASSTPSPRQSSGSQGNDPTAKQPSGASPSGSQQGGSQSGADSKSGSQGGSQSGGQQQQGAGQSNGPNSPIGNSPEQGSKNSPQSSQGQANDQKNPGSPQQQPRDGRSSNDPSSQRGNDPASPNQPGNPPAGQNNREQPPKDSNNPPNGNSSSGSGSPPNTPPEQRQNNGQNTPSGASSRRQSQSQPQSAPSSSQPATPPTPSLSSSDWFAGLGTFMKWIVYVVLACIAVYLIWRYREAILAAWHELLADLKKFWQKLFGGKTAAANQAEAAAVAPAAAPRPFSSFHDPFLTGAASRTTPEQLVRYSFAALEAWAAERGTPRKPEETPLEFASLIGAYVPELAVDARNVAMLQARVSYSQGRPAAGALDMLREFWLHIGSVHASAQPDSLATGGAARP